MMDFFSTEALIALFTLTSFLLRIGTLLVAEGFHQKIPKGYVYFAMVFCLGVEMLQMKAGKPVAREVMKAS